jgi:glutamate synthase (NADPH/NADH) small chain
LEEQCIQDCPPPCTSYCPVHVDVRRMAAAASQKDFAAGLKVFRKSTPFPEIVARTCDQPCQYKCNRDTLGGVIRVADIELACVTYGSGFPDRITVLPGKKARVVVIGGGLSGMTAAYDLARKGYQVVMFESETRLGGRLWDFPEDQLPRDVILKETGIIAEVGIELHLGEKAEAGIVFSEEFDAVYLGTGKQNPGYFELDVDSSGFLILDPVTFQTSQAKVFSGGSLRNLPPSTVRSISDGRRAAISIDRFLQNVSLTASRANEGAYETRLVTNIAGIEAVEAAAPAFPAKIYSPDEAAAEAARCLQCECMECVKVCEYLKHYGSYPRKYVREIYNNLSIIMRVRSGNKFVNSCTLCGLCEEVCPTDLNMGKVNHEVRRTMVKTGKMPISAHDFALRDMAFSNSEKYALTLGSEGSEICSYLFFPGCQLAASNPEYILQVYRTLASVLPDLGVMLRCCGAPADWAGEEEIFRQSMEELKEQWLKAGRPILVVACSSCHGIFKQYLPEAELISIWEIFEKHALFPAGRGSGKQFVIHDPCTSRHEDTWQNSTRAALAAMGVPYHELALSRNLTACCGYGGVAWLAHPELVHDIVQRRVGEDPADYLTYCVMCRDLFAAEGKPTLHLLDLMYGRDLDTLSRRKGPDYSQRHENRARARQAVVKLLSGKDEMKVENYEKIQLVIKEEMRTRLEDRLILVEDIQKVIEHAEASGECFINQETGHSLAYFKPNLITYWVEYSKAGDAYEVHDAYSHRMDFEGEAGK